MTSQQDQPDRVPDADTNVPVVPVVEPPKMPDVMIDDVVVPVVQPPGLPPVSDSPSAEDSTRSDYGRQRVVVVAVVVVVVL